MGWETCQAWQVSEKGHPPYSQGLTSLCLVVSDYSHRCAIQVDRASGQLLIYQHIRLLILSCNLSSGGGGSRGQTDLADTLGEWGFSNSSCTRAQSILREKECSSVGIEKIREVFPERGLMGEQEQPGVVMAGAKCGHGLNFQNKGLQLRDHRK